MSNEVQTEKTTAKKNKTLKGKGEAKKAAAPANPPLVTNSVVDRGVTEVTITVGDVQETKSVKWVATKSVTTDSKTTKILSTVYRLSFDDEAVETKDFETLSALRASVGKVITPPTKTTMSRADHVAARGSGSKKK